MTALLRADLRARALGAARPATLRPARRAAWPAPAGARGRRRHRRRPRGARARRRRPGRGGGQHAGRHRLPAAGVDLRPAGRCPGGLHRRPAARARRRAADRARPRRPRSPHRRRARPDRHLPQVSVENAAPHPLERGRVDRQVGLGVRALDALVPVGRGQRVGIFAGSGVGKSTLLSMIARGSEATISSSPWSASVVARSASSWRTTSAPRAWPARSSWSPPPTPRRSSGCARPSWPPASRSGSATPGATSC